MASRIIISVTNDLSNDQRVHRVAVALQERGYEVCLVGRKRPNSKPLAPRSYETKRLRFYFDSGKLFYLSYAIKMFWWLLFQPAVMLLANDMDTILPNFLVAKLRGRRLIYDSHEYWTEVPELIDRKLTRAVWLWLERRLFPRVDLAYTVNQSLAEIYQKAYNIPVGVVRNLPFGQVAGNTTEPKANILLYQGALNIGRGIELMIEAMRYLPDYQLKIAGVGDIEDPLRRLVAARPYHAQIQFLGFVAPEELRMVTQNAKLGLSLEADRGASYHFALPNKLFDYIQAGVPVLVSDLPEMARVIESFQVGETLATTARQPAQLANKIREICENVDKYKTYSTNCQQAAKTLNWEEEKKALYKLMEQLP